MKYSIIYTTRDQKWLYQHGERFESDVKIDSQGRRHVLMSDGQGMLERIYLPEVITKEQMNIKKEEFVRNAIQRSRQLKHKEWLENQRNKPKKIKIGDINPDEITGIKIYEKK